MINEKIIITSKRSEIYGYEYTAVKEDKLYYLVLLEKGGMMKIPKNICEIKEQK